VFMLKRKGLDKKKIVYFTDSRGWGGAEKYLMDLVTAIDRDKYDPEVIFPMESEIKSFGECFIERGVSVDWVNTSNKYPFLSFIRSFYCFINKRPDLIHFNLSWPSFCRYPILAAILFGKVIVLTEHLVPHNYKVEPYEKFYKRFIYSRIFQAIAVCSENKSNLIHFFELPEEKITVIRNGITISRFQLSDFRNVRDCISHLTNGKIVVTTVARLAEHKGHCFLIKAAQRLMHLPDLCFLIVGEGPLKELLVQDVKDSGMEDRFLFLGFREDIPYILSKTDIFVLPSLFEGLPLTVLEAMAAGKPVIASNVSGIVEEVRNGETGILIPPGDPVALSKAIEMLARDPEKRKQMGAEGGKRVEKHFNYLRMITETEQIYDRAFTAS